MRGGGLGWVQLADCSDGGRRKRECRACQCAYPTQVDDATWNLSAQGNGRWGAHPCRSSSWRQQEFPPGAPCTPLEASTWTSHSQYVEL